MTPHAKGDGSELDDETLAVLDMVENTDFALPANASTQEQEDELLLTERAPDIPPPEAQPADKPQQPVEKEPPKPKPVRTVATSPQAVNFAQVDTLRKHMLLTASDMASILGVSRVTYHGWVKGNPIRKTNLTKVKARLRKLLAIVQSGWPDSDVIVMSNKERVARLLERMESLV